MSDHPVEEFPVTDVVLGAGTVHGIMLSGDLYEPGTTIFALALDTPGGRSTFALSADMARTVAGMLLRGADQAEGGKT